MSAIHLVTGDDPSLRDRAVDSLVQELLDGDDRSLALDDLTVPHRRVSGDGDADGEVGDTPVFTRFMTAVDSPPFMTSRRVVVLRDVGSLSAQQVTTLVEWLSDPADTTVLVLVGGGGRLSSKLSNAVKEAGGQRHSPESERRAKRGEPGPVGKQLNASLDEANLEVAPDARSRIEAHLGEDAGRVPELVGILRSTFGEGARLGAAEIEPYLGESGTAARYDLANAIDAGDVAGALAVLDRLLHSTSGTQAKPLHPIQLMATLQFHYRDLLRLDDPAIGTKEQAAEALGMKSAWAARHRLDAARALGSDGLREAYTLLARADVDLRGASGVPEETVVEVLVARLASLTKRHARGGQRAASSSRS